MSGQVRSSQTQQGAFGHGRGRAIVPLAFVALAGVFLLLAFLLPSPAQTEPKGPRFLNIREVVSPGGIRAWLVPDASVPVIAMEFAFKGAGSALETPEKQGLVRLLSNTMDEGAGKLDSQAFQGALREDSIDLHFGASRDDFTGSLKTLKENRARAFELMKMALASPRFDPEPVERMKAANIARIKGSLSDPDWLAARLMNDVAFKGHPYALNSGGTLTTLPAIRPEDLKAFARTQLTKDRLKIAVVGDITPEELAPALDEIFGGLPAKAPPSGVPDLALQGAGESVLLRRKIPQTVIQTIQPGVARADPDYYTASVMNFILGSSGFGSRLMEEAREKRGLTYGIYTDLLNLDHVPTLIMTASTENTKAAELMKIVHEQWTKMRDTPVTQAELDAAKAYLIGSMPLSLSSTDRIAGLVLSLQLDSLPIDTLDQRVAKISAVSIADISRVAKNLLAPGKLTVIMVGEPQGVQPTRTVETLPNVE